MDDENEKTYTVTWEETHRYSAVIEANSEDEALEKFNDDDYFREENDAWVEPETIEVEEDED